jgi:integrase
MNSDLPILADAPASAIIPATAGTAASAAAAATIFPRYQQRLAPATRDRQRSDLARFAEYLAAVQVIAPSETISVADALVSAPSAWAAISWGLIEGFVEWMLREGDATGSISVRLATIRRYCQLAAQAGAIADADLAFILRVKAPGGKAARNLDAERDVTRRSGEKDAAIVLEGRHIKQLKQQPDTPQGRRDALILTILLDHGLRVGELAALTIGAIDAVNGLLVFYRPKVDRRQTHRLTADALVAASRYLSLDRAEAAPADRLLVGSRKGGSLAATGMSVQAIRERVRRLGQAVGVPNLSPHDLRHTWATRAQRGGTSAFALRDAGGWSSLAMPNRYAHAAAIANDEVTLAD